MTDVVERQSDYKWLREIAPQVYDRASHPYAQPTLRRLTDDELDRIDRVIRKHKLPCTAHNLNTSVGMMVHEHPLEAPYPGITSKDLVPYTLIFLPAKALPLSLAKKMGDRILFDDAWDWFVNFTHTDENQALLARCGLPEQRPKGYYEY